MGSSQTFFGRIAAALGALAVVTGAFGAHGLESRLDEDMLAIWETAVRYHFYHVIPLFALALAPTSFWTRRWAALASGLWIAGIAIFSGSLYVLALSGIRWLGAITPFGGLALIAAWCCAILAFTRN